MNEEYYIISLDKNLTSYVFYNEILSNLHQYYVLRDNREIVFDFTTLKSIDGLTIPNLLCVCHIIKDNSGFVPKMVFSSNIATGNLRKYINDIKLVNIGETYGLIEFDDSVKGGWTDNGIKTINTSLAINKNDTHNAIWSKLTKAMTKFLYIYSKEFEVFNTADKNKNEILDIIFELLKNSVDHGKSFAVMTIQYNYALSKIKIAISDCGKGFLNTINNNGFYKNSIQCTNNLEAIAYALFRRRCDDMYGLHHVIKQTLRHDNNIVRIHSMDTQIVFTKKMLLDFEFADTPQKMINAIKKPEYKNNINNKLKYGGVHIEFELQIQGGKDYV